MLVMQFTRLLSLADYNKIDYECDRMNTLNGYITKNLRYLTHLLTYTKNPKCLNPEI